MAGRGLARQLASLLSRSGTCTSSTAQAAPIACFQRAYASAVDPSSLSRTEIVHLLDNREDPEVDAAVRAYLKQQYQAGGKAAAGGAEEEDASLEFTSKIQHKYVAAQVVEYGIQNVNVPLAYDKEGSVTPLKRYVSQLQIIGDKAGFEDPTVELSKRLSEIAAVSDSAKEFLSKARPYVSPEYHGALMEALQGVENELGATVTLDAASPGYKKFADKIKSLAQGHKIPWQLLLSYQQKVAEGSVDEDTRDQLARDYKAWLQSAQLTDAKSEMSDLKAEATRILDTHLSKTAEQGRHEIEAAMAQMLKRLEAAKGAPWAQKFQEDLKYLSWFDSCVASNPAQGPRPAA